MLKDRDINRVFLIFAKLGISKNGLFYTLIFEPPKLMYPRVFSHEKSIGVKVEVVRPREHGEKSIFVPIFALF